MCEGGKGEYWGCRSGGTTALDKEGAREKGYGCTHRLSISLCGVEKRLSEG